MANANPTNSPKNKATEKTEPTVTEVVREAKSKGAKGTKFVITRR